MANQIPVLVPAGAPVIAQVRIDRGSLSSTETLQSSESDISATPKAALVQTNSLSTITTTNATDDPARIEAGYETPAGDSDDDATQHIPRTAGWIKAAFTMFKTQVGLGVLQLPKAFALLGLMPGICCLIFFTIVAFWLGFQIDGAGKRYPRVRSLAHVGEMIAGRVGAEVFGGAYFLYFLFVGTSAISSISIALNAVSQHAACTNVWFGIAALVALALCSIRTIGKVGPLAVLGTISIIAAMIVFLAALGAGNRPIDAPPSADRVSDWKLIGELNIKQILTGISYLSFSWSGLPSFFNIRAEMKEPKLYKRALTWSLSAVAIVYMTVAVTVYVLCGSHVSSPALGSAGPRFKIICYGIALIGLCVTACLMLHYAAKHLYQRVTAMTTESRKGASSPDSTTPIVRNVSNPPTPAQKRRDLIIWYSCSSSVTILAYIIANAVPNFQDLVALIGAFLGTFICFHPMACLWFHDNWRSTRRNKMFWSRACWHAFLLVLGSFLVAACTWAACSNIAVSSTSVKPWSCAENSDK